MVKNLNMTIELNLSFLKYQKIVSQYKVIHQNIQMSQQPPAQNIPTSQQTKNPQTIQQIAFIRQQQKLQKQRIKILYQQIKIQKQKSQRLQNEHYDNLKKMNQKIYVEGKGNVYQQVDDNDYREVPVDGQVYLGSRVYMVNCSGCHSLEIVTNTRDSAPTLGMIFNRKAATDLNYFNYSKSAIAKSFYWTTKNLYKFMADPQSLIPNTRCGLAMKPLKLQSDRADLVTFLRDYSKQLQLNTRIELIKKEGYDMYQTKLYAQKLKNQKIQKDLIGGKK